MVPLSFASMLRVAASLVRELRPPACSPEELDAPGRLLLLDRLHRMFHLSSPDAYQGLSTFGDWVAHTLHCGSDTQITVATSGSTGEPKYCTHSWQELEQEIACWVGRFGGVQRIVSLVPSHHIYGFLWTVVLPERLGVPVVESRGLGVQPRPGDLVVGFPTRWETLRRTIHRWPDGVEGVTSTAPCEPQLIEALLSAGLSRMTEVYGSSETGALGVRTSPREAYELLPYWQPCAGGVMRGAGVIEPPDYWEWAGARHFRPAGRRDQAVQVGGVNVYPQRVAAQLREHPAVADAAVRLMRPGEGSRLKALLVLRADVGWEPAVEQRLYEWLRQRLSAPEIPAAITIADELPRGGLGKLQDWEIDERRLNCQSA